MFDITTLHGWTPGGDSIVCWHPSQATLDAAAKAPVNTVPLSYQQAQHLRRYHDHVTRGVDMSRLMTFAWELPGRCDVRTMSYVINAHVRRHDTYHSWFELHDVENIVRHHIERPGAIEMVPVEHPGMTVAQLREHMLDQHPLEWDNFMFGIVQAEDRFTFYASISHLRVDPMIVGVLFMEIHMMYSALIGGAAPVKMPAAGRYLDYCASQRADAAALTAECPSVRRWIDFAVSNGGTLPAFPLSLGDLSKNYAGKLLTVTLMDKRQTEQFEAACIAAGARFSGGVFACAGLTERELTGTETFSAITTTDTRRTPTELMTTGWFTGLVPITVPVGAGVFEDSAAAAQASFDAGIDLATVPFERVLALAPSELGLGRARLGNLVISFLDASIAPLSTVANSDLNFRIYDEGRVAHQVSMWVNRYEHQTTVTLSFPNNPIARASVEAYIAAMRTVYVRVADGRRSLPYASSLR